MRFDELFEMRKLTGIKLKDYISGNGFSKVSFCKKAEISRPTLDKISNGEIDSKSSFDKHLNKIFTSLGIGPDTLMEFSTKTAKRRCDVLAKGSDKLSNEWIRQRWSMICCRIF